jgi:hypothetical protein
MAAIAPYQPMAKPLMQPTKPPIGHPAVMPNTGSVAGVYGQQKPNIAPPAPGGAWGPQNPNYDGPITNPNNRGVTPEGQMINNLPPGIDPRAVAADPQGYQRWQQQRQMMMQGQSQTPQFGLQGQENALTTAARGAGGAIQGGMNRATNTLSGAYNLGMNNLRQGVGALNGGFGSGVSRGTATDVNQQTGQGQFQQGINNLNQDFSGQGFTSNAANVNQNVGQDIFGQAAQGFDQFGQYSPQAMQQQAALSGALGQEAFDQAFLNSPVQQFLRQQGEESIANQAAATGGLGGGEVLKELTRFGQGLAGTQLQQQIDNLAGIGNRGLQAQQGRANMMGQAGNQMGQLAGQNASMQQQTNLSNASNLQNASFQNAANRLNAAGQQSNMFGQMGNLEAQLAGQNAQNRTNTSLQNANMANQVGMANARNSLSAAQGQANLFGQGANLASALGGQAAGLQYGAGNNLANMLTGIGTQIGNARSQAGRDIAMAQQGAAQTQAGNVNNQAAALAELMQAQGMNAMDIISQLGNSGSEGMLAQLLANAATKNATNQSTALSNSGRPQADLNLIRGQNIMDTIGNIYQSGADSGWWGG